MLYKSGERYGWFECAESRAIMGLQQVLYTTLLQTGTFDING